MSKVMKLAGKILESRENRREFTICIVGCGRTGLVTACLFVEAGFNVIAVDSSSHIVHILKTGKSPFTESDLRKFISKHVKNNRFKATTNLRKAVSESDVIVFGIQTSLDKKRKPDYSRLEKACKEVGSHVLAITNVKGSTISREADSVMYIKAGPEIGVATTKAFIGQLISLYILSLCFAL